METLELAPTTRSELFEKLYLKAFPATCRFVKTMGGSLDDARDVFQDGLLLFYEKELRPGEEPMKDEVAYLLGICKHVWYQKHRSKSRLVSLAVLPEQLASPTSEPRVSASLLRSLEASGKKCLELLSAFYYDKLNMKDIAQRFGFSGERSATAQKYKCLEKVRNHVKEQCIQKEDFYE